MCLDGRDGDTMYYLQGDVVVILLWKYPFSRTLDSNNPDETWRKRVSVCTQIYLLCLLRLSFIFFLCVFFLVLFYCLGSFVIFLVIFYFFLANPLLVLGMVEARSVIVKGLHTLT